MVCAIENELFPAKRSSNTSALNERSEFSVRYVCDEARACAYGNIRLMEAQTRKSTDQEKRRRNKEKMRASAECGL